MRKLNKKTLRGYSDEAVFGYTCYRVDKMSNVNYLGTRVGIVETKADAERFIKGLEPKKIILLPANIFEWPKNGPTVKHHRAKKRPK